MSYWWIALIGWIVGYVAMVVWCDLRVWWFDPNMWSRRFEGKLAFTDMERQVVYLAWPLYLILLIVLLYCRYDSKKKD